MHIRESNQEGFIYEKEVFQEVFQFDSLKNKNRQINDQTRANIINKFNAMANKRIKEKNDTIVVEQGVMMNPMTISLRPPFKESTELKARLISDQNKIARKHRQYSQVDQNDGSVQFLRPLENDDVPGNAENESPLRKRVLKASNQEFQKAPKLSPNAQLNNNSDNQPSFSLLSTDEKSFLKQLNVTNQEEIIKNEKQNLAEIFKKLVSDIQQLHPDKKNLTQQEQTQFLIEKLLNLKQLHNYRRKKAQLTNLKTQEIEQEKELSSRDAMLKLLSPMQIINNFNITINHQDQNKDILDQRVQDFIKEQYQEGKYLQRFHANIRSRQNLSTERSIQNEINKIRNSSLQESTQSLPLLTRVSQVSQETESQRSEDLLKMKSRSNNISKQIYGNNQAQQLIKTNNQPLVSPRSDQGLTHNHIPDKLKHFQIKAQQAHVHQDEPLQWQSQEILLSKESSYERKHNKQPSNQPIKINLVKRFNQAEINSLLIPPKLRQEGLFNETQQRTQKVTKKPPVSDPKIRVGKPSMKLGTNQQSKFHPNTQLLIKDAQTDLPYTDKIHSQGNDSKIKLTEQVDYKVTNFQSSIQAYNEAPTNLEIPQFSQELVQEHNVLVDPKQSINEDSSPGKLIRQGFSQELMWGQNKKGIPTQQIYKEQLKIKLDYNGIDEPDCIIVGKQNACCKLIRNRHVKPEQKLQTQRSAQKQKPIAQKESQSKFVAQKTAQNPQAQNLQTRAVSLEQLEPIGDLLVIVFDGVIGSFVNLKNTQSSESSDERIYEQLYLRPAAAEAITQLAEVFKIAIVLQYESRRMVKAVKKALINVPYDRLYQKVAWKQDNFFNIENMLQDNEVEESRVMFVTACMFSGQTLSQTSNLNPNQISKELNRHMIETVTVKDDFGLMPTALNLENQVIFTVPHLSIEMGNDLKPLTQYDKNSFDHAQQYQDINVETSMVAEFTTFLQPLLSLFKISRTLMQNNAQNIQQTLNSTKKTNLAYFEVKNLKFESMRKKERVSSDDPVSEIKQSQISEYEPDSSYGSIGSTDPGFQAGKRNHRKANLANQDQIKEFLQATPSLTRFKILTDINDYEIFYPVKFYLEHFKQIEQLAPQGSANQKAIKSRKKQRKKHQKQKDQTFLENWDENVFSKAFNKIKNYELFSSLYFQPDRFNREIIGKRLQPVMLKIKLKLKKIQQAKRIVEAFLYKQKMLLDEDNFKEVLLQRQRNANLRHHIAYQTYTKYNQAYFQEIYEECLVRLPLHPTLDQLYRLSRAYKTLHQRLEDLITQRFLTGRDKDDQLGIQSQIRQRKKNYGIEDVEAKLLRLDSDYLSQFKKHIAFVANQQKNYIAKYRDTHPYNIIVFQSHLAQKAKIVKSIQVKCGLSYTMHKSYRKDQKEILKEIKDNKKTELEISKGTITNLIEWMSQPQLNSQQIKTKWTEDDDDKGDNTD